MISLIFDDIERSQISGFENARPPMSADLRPVFGFVDERPHQAILVHCRVGVSRSTAVTLALILRGYEQAGRNAYVDEAVGLLLTMRPHATPNALILRLCLEACLPAGRVEAVVEAVNSHPALMQNRFVKPLER
jgi:predicted protein tyrosine phosphatase